MPINLLHDQPLTENEAVFCFSLLALRQKRDSIKSHLQVLQYVILFMAMASLTMKIAINVAGILLFASIGLLVFNLIRETQHLREVQAQILRMCHTTEFEHAVRDIDANE